MWTPAGGLKGFHCMRSWLPRIIMSAMLLGVPAWASADIADEAMAGEEAFWAARKASDVKAVQDLLASGYTSVESDCNGLEFREGAPATVEHLKTDLADGTYGSYKLRRVSAQADGNAIVLTVGWESRYTPKAGGTRAIRYTTGMETVVWARSAPGAGSGSTATRIGGLSTLMLRRRHRSDHSGLSDVARGRCAERSESIRGDSAVPRRNRGGRRRRVGEMVRGQVGLRDLQADGPARARAEDRVPQVRCLPTRVGGEGRRGGAEELAPDVDEDQVLGLKKLAFAVGNVDAAAARLRTQGVRFVVQPFDDGPMKLRSFIVADPDGNLLQFMQETR